MKNTACDYFYVNIYYMKNSLFIHYNASITHDCIIMNIEKGIMNTGDFMITVARELLYCN